MTSYHATVCQTGGKTTGAKDAFEVEFVGGFCWMETPRLDIYLPAIFSADSTV